MDHVNYVELLGVCGEDPIIKYTSSGKCVVNMTVTTRKEWEDRDGNNREKTEYHRTVYWEDLALEVSEKRKGDPVHLEGYLKTRSWTNKNDMKHYVTEIIAKNIL